MDSPGFDSLEVRIYFVWRKVDVHKTNIKVKPLIAVCEYSYQFHPIGLWCGSIPHGVTILFFIVFSFFCLFCSFQIKYHCKKVGDNILAFRRKRSQ